jgi:hypothetical protein
MNKREAKVVELRLMGRTYEEIAKECGYRSASGAWQAYQRARTEIIIEPLEELRHLELMRLDDALLSISDRAFSGDLPAISTMLKIMDRRAKLLGLDKPARAEADLWEIIDGNDIDAEIQRVTEMMDEREKEFLGQKEKELRTQIRLELEMEQSQKNRQGAETALTSDSRLLDVGSAAQNEN